MKTFKQFLNESLSCKEYSNLAYRILSSYKYFKKSCEYFGIDESDDDLSDEIYFKVKTKNDCYKVIKDVTRIDLKHMTDAQMNEILYILCFDTNWIEKIAKVLIKLKLGDIKPFWSDSDIMIVFEDEKLNSKQLKDVIKELEI